MISRIIKRRFASGILFLIFTFLIFSSAQAQTTAFNFQGRINDGGNAANGRYDLQFKLFDALTGGNQIGIADRTNTQVINGVFSTVLDFGAAFTSGNRFLEISVRPNGSSNAHVVLGARQQILAVPFAAHSATSGNAVSLGGVSANNYARLNFANQGDVVGANIGSNGYLSVQGNAFQPANANGFVKAMVAVTANGNLVRCYNGVTGSTSCTGFSASIFEGRAEVVFPFPVRNRFWTVNPDASFFQSASRDEITASVGTSNFNPETTLQVFLFKNGSATDMPFHLFVF